MTRAIATRITVLAALVLSTSYASEAEGAAAFLKCDYEVRYTPHDGSGEHRALTEHFSFENSLLRVLDSDGWIDFPQQCASVQPAAITIQVAGPEDPDGECTFVGGIIASWFTGTLTISRVDGSIEGSSRDEFGSFEASGQCVAVSDPLTTRAF